MTAYRRMTTFLIAIIYLLSACKNAPTEPQIPEPILIGTDTITTIPALLPHVCTKLQGFNMEPETIYISNSPDGSTDGITETIPAQGAILKVTGFNRFVIRRYSNGNNDTILLDKKTISSLCAVTGWYKNNNDSSTWERCEGKGHVFVSSYKDGFWTIPAIGPVWTNCITHTLTLTDGITTKCFTLNQNVNVPIGVYGEDKYHFLRCKLENRRDSLPSWRDYPPGSEPPWARGPSGYWWSPDQSRELHPTSYGRRLIILRITVEHEIMKAPVLYRSGAVSTDSITEKHEGDDIHTWIAGHLIITAKADIPLADGSTRHEEHTFEWQQPKKKTRRRDYALLIPPAPDAANNFSWKLSAEYKLEKNGYFPVDIEKSTNFKTADFSIPDFTAEEDCRTFNQMCLKYGIRGFIESTREACLADNINKVADLRDGIENPDKYYDISWEKEY